MTYHWSKNQPAPTAFIYKGLTFPLYQGKNAETLSENSGRRRIFAFFGNRALTEDRIIYHVERMIEKGEYKHSANAA